MSFDRIYQPEEVEPLVVELVRRNQQKSSIHIRPSVCVLGMGSPGETGPVDLHITSVERPTPKWVTDGCSAQVSSWQRISDRAMPPRVKANANYNNSRFAAIQANKDGYDTAILLNDRGMIAEGPGMCMFIVRKGRVHTPSITNDILESITRDTVIDILADDMALETSQRDVNRSELFGIEEAFFAGTAWEITPITNIDKRPVGDGTVGPITKRLQERYFDIVHGRVNDDHGWLTPVY